MRIFGYFASVKRDIYRVDINIKGKGKDIEIKPDGDLQFADEDAVTIDSGVDNSFDVVQQQMCTISLQAARYIGQLFTLEYKDASVEVSRVVSGYLTDKEQLDCVFSGWLEPRTLSQPFNERYDDLSLQAVDCLSAMQYSPFRNVGVSTTYGAAVRAAGQSTFRALLTECLTAGCGSLDGYAVFYDGSKAIDLDDIFTEITVKDMIFLGDDEDDTMDCRSVVEALLKYLNLHIVQYGKAFYIYSWESLRKGSAAWTQILGGATDITPIDAGSTVVISSENAEDTDTQIDVTEVFNQVALSVSLKKQDSAIVSPLDSSGKVPAMGPRRPYVTEFAADGEGVKAHKSFFNLVKYGKDETQYDHATYKDYYVRVMRNVNWTIGSGGTDWAQAQADADPTNPNAVVTRLRNERGALLLGIGKVDHKPGKGDNTPQTTISMDDCLVVSVNGNGSNDRPSPTADDLLGIAPVAEYNGGGEGTVYSPADEGATNYLVIDGSITLVPLMDISATIDKVQACADYAETYSINGFHTVPSRDNDDGRFLTFGWWQPFDGTAASGSPLYETTNATGYALLGTGENARGWIPDTEDGPEQYEYQSKGEDNISKVGILECMLVIGGIEDGTAQVLVEDEGTNGEKSGAMGLLSWKPYRTLEQCGNDKDAYYAQSFAIGIDPKKGDKIIGKEYDIATNFDYNTNISAEKGMAIPLPHEAKLSGKILFQILGPVNEMWDDNVRRHRTWFRREKWTTTAVPLLAHVSSIIVKSLSIKMYTPTEDTGGDDADVVYLSKVSHSFYNKKDGLEFKVHSGFTQQEISQYNLSDSALVGMVYGSDRLPLLSIEDKNTGNKAKPEKLYVDAAYNELHAPRIVLTQSLRLQGGGINPFSLYRHPALGRNFYVRYAGRNLMAGSVQLSLGECF